MEKIKEKGTLYLERAIRRFYWLRTRGLFPALIDEGT